MALGTDRDHGIRKELNGTAPNPESSSDGTRADIIAAVWGEGTAFPTGAANLWRGRQFTRTDLGATYIYTGSKWLQVSLPLVATGPAIAGASWDGVGALQLRVGHVVVTASAANSGNAPIPIEPFANGLLFADIQLIESVCATVKLRHSAQSPASSLSQLEVNLTTASGANAPASSQHRLAYYAVGW